ncbi:MAG: (d)CMP kinase [Eubacteriales bacterium]|nr:(d)CMP kinase [Eubacteriales bacterium]
MKRISIAIDGPSGSGKSTAAKNLAKILNIEYIDTGAMYRAAALKALQENVPVDNDKITAMLDNTEIDFSNGSILLDGIDVGDSIRTLEVSSMASRISALPGCRKKLVDIQRLIASKKSVVMDGRDIGTHVLPDADYKFYITAPLETRAKRRWLEIGERDGVTLDEVRRDLAERDKLDTTRALDPLVKADDAIEISTDKHGIYETAELLRSYIK